MARENSSHAPGSQVIGGGMRQRAAMAGGAGGEVGGNFGVGKLPGSKRIPMGGHEREGAMMGDSKRANPPPIHMGEGSMHATAHSKHGPHGHRG